MTEAPTPALMLQFLKDNKATIDESFRRAIDMHPAQPAIRENPDVLVLCRDFFFGGVASMFMQATAVDLDARTVPAVTGTAANVHDDDDGPW